MFTNVGRGVKERENPPALVLELCVVFDHIYRPYEMKWECRVKNKKKTFFLILFSRVLFTAVLFGLGSAAFFKLNTRCLANE